MSCPRFAIVVIDSAAKAAAAQVHRFSSARGTIPCKRRVDKSEVTRIVHRATSAISGRITVPAGATLGEIVRERTLHEIRGPGRNGNCAAITRARTPNEVLQTI